MKLIHIGLPKTGSTSFQSQWYKRNDINLVSDGLNTLVEETRKAIKIETDPNLLLDLWPKALGKQSITLYSSEGLSGIPWGNQTSEHKYDYGHYLFANLCKENVPDGKVLVFIRSPESWLRSVYFQMIHEGKNFGFTRFIRHQRSYIANILNLNDFLKHWDDAFGEDNVIVYPFERLISSPDVANQEISTSLGIPPALNLFQLQQQSNASLNSESAQLLRAASIFNRRIQGPSNNLANTFNKLNEDMRLLYRVELQRRPRAFGFSKELLSPLNFSLPEVERKFLKVLIQDGFLAEIIRRGDKYKIAETYQTRVEQHF
ncbi:hypothetical protein J3L16_01640 [Alteromonas sp. 5E99-2]|uniref:hypothetical protein n=1 Tax=Alteromonas sp. 5E99-2 TaxID=2817683 RepID=UPI001A98C71E|nr:hypothetical protein [Alteromonas sp. 5E99-2]MBO1254382.1 hypothetical protein [Alteromonas sp. 5E99-2]